MKTESFGQEDWISIAESTMHEEPGDILLWPDGSWCYREEFHEALLHGNTYQIVRRGSEEWIKINSRVAATSAPFNSLTRRSRPNFEHSR